MCPWLGPSGAGRCPSVRPTWRHSRSAAAIRVLMPSPPGRPHPAHCRDRTPRRRPPSPSPPRKCSRTAPGLLSIICRSDGARMPKLVSRWPLVDATMGVPALVLGRRSDVLAWNPLGHALLAGHLPADAPASAATRPTMASLVFLDADTVALYTDWRSKARAVVGNLRLTVGLHPADPELASLIEQNGKCVDALPYFRAFMEQTSSRDSATEARWRMFFAVDVLQLIGVTFIGVQVLVLLVPSRRAFTVTTLTLAAVLVVGAVYGAVTLARMAGCGACRRPTRRAGSQARAVACGAGTSRTRRCRRETGA